MIESIKIKNFQSLHDVDLELGKFTVIVGASSTGKSAITRAIKAVTSNALDSDYITRGTKRAAVSLRTEDATITIERELGDSSVYKIAKIGSQESRYPKLNRQVPAEVTAALGILPSTKEVSSINFAGQFDAPYLLTEKGSIVATILGELTNVATIFAAVREASRRVKNASTLLNLRKKDRDQVSLTLGSYTSLPAKVKKIKEIEIVLTQAQEIEDKISALSSLILNIEKYSTVEVPLPVEDISSTIESYESLNDFKSLLKKAILAQKQIIENEQNMVLFQQQLEDIDAEIHRLLVEAGSCPTCNRRI